MVSALTRLPLCLLLAAGCAKEAADAAPVEAPPAEAPRTAPCVYFKDLEPFLPKALPGYATSRDEGSSGKYGDVSVSEAERVFSLGDRELAVRIVDTTVSYRLGEKIRAAAREAEATPAGNPTAPLRLASAVGFVRFDSSEDRAEANLWVGDRFVVAVTGRGFRDAREVRDLAGGLDLAGLSKLR